MHVQISDKPIWIITCPLTVKTVAKSSIQWPSYLTIVQIVTTNPTSARRARLYASQRAAIKHSSTEGILCSTPKLTKGLA